MKLYEPFQFLTTDECDSIIAYAQKNKIQQGTTSYTRQSENVRNNRIVWYNDSSRWTEWIKMFNTIEPVIDWIQDPQISLYNPGEEYKWHDDTRASYRRTHIRYFTLTCELQSASGAGIEVKNKDIPKLKKGEAVVFKSLDRHRATSPTEGERISFTIWAMALNPNRC